MSNSLVVPTYPQEPGCSADLSMVDVVKLSSYASRNCRIAKDGLVEQKTVAIKNADGPVVARTTCSSKPLSRQENTGHRGPG